MNKIIILATLSTLSFAFNNYAVSEDSFNKVYEEDISVGAYHFRIPSHLLRYGRELTKNCRAHAKNIFDTTGQNHISSHQLKSILAQELPAFEQRYQQDMLDGIRFDECVARLNPEQYRKLHNRVKQRYDLLPSHSQARNRLKTLDEILNDAERAVAVMKINLEELERLQNE
jgi:hypothetical protein